MRDAEPVSEQADVVEVAGVRFVAEVAINLKFGVDAANCPAGDCTASSETFGRVAKLTASRQCLDRRNCSPSRASIPHPPSIQTMAPVASSQPITAETSVPVIIRSAGLSFQLQIAGGAVAMTGESSDGVAVGERGLQRGADTITPDERIFGVVSQQPVDV